MERLEEAMTASVQYQDALQVCASLLMCIVYWVFIFIHCISNYFCQLHQLKIKKLNFNLFMSQF